MSEGQGLSGRFPHAEHVDTLGDSAVEYSKFHAGFAARALHLLGDVAIHSDRFNAERGESHLRQALALVPPAACAPLLPTATSASGKLYRCTDKPEQAGEHLATATTMYRDMGMTYWLEKAEAENADLS